MMGETALERLSDLCYPGIFFDYKGFATRKLR
jgi:hypothetical protein